MVDGLLDTSVLVDILRQYPKAEQWAKEKMIQLRLTHDIEPMDFLIAGTAHRLQIPLYTNNLKDFHPILTSLAIKPY